MTFREGPNPDPDSSHGRAVPGGAQPGHTPPGVTPPLSAQVPVFLLFLAASAVVAWVGSQWTTSSVTTWYAALDKPPWTPPNFLFGPVWTLLYAAMATAAWLVWRRGGWAPNRGAFSLYAVQLLLNLLWSGLFFGQRSPLWGMVDITLLWLAILGTLILFYRRSRLAGALMVPYLAWVSYAAALNLAILRLNGPGL